MIDFLIMYEVKQREIESIILIGNELKRRGYSVEYLSFFQIDNEKQTKKYFNNVRVVLMPSLYHNKELMNIVYRLAGPVKKIVNLQWEQVGTVKAEQNINSYMFPHEMAKKAIHICWGEKPAKNLIKSGVSSSNAIITGPVHMDFLRPIFNKYYIDKNNLFERYNLNHRNKTVLFISSFVYSNLTERQIKEVEKVWGRDWVRKQRELAINSFEKMIEWIEELLDSNTNINFIYRPHPVENSNKKLVEIQSKYRNFRVIGEYSVKQWILACDILTTWISTSIAEAFFADKPCAILRPEPIPVEQEMTVLVNSQTVNSLEKYLSIVELGNKISLGEEIIKSYYDVDIDVPSYLRLCRTLEDIINNDAYNFPWDKNLIQEYERGRMKRSLVKVVKKNYLSALKAGLWLQKKLNISFGDVIDQRIVNYDKTTMKENENIASEKEIENISKRINEIIKNK